jgi:hypothetical protein
VLLSRRRQSCDELDTDVLTAVGKPRSVRPRGRSVMSQLFYPVSVLLLFFHSIVLLFSAPLLLHFPFTPAVLLFTLLGEGTQPSCCRYGIQKIEKENERVEVRALVCSQQLLEENQTHERQPVSTNPSEALHSDQEKRCGEKDSLSFPSRPGLKLREDRYIGYGSCIPLPSLRPPSRRWSRT